MRRPVLLVVGGLVAGAVLPGAVARAATVQADGATQTVPCAGGDAVVEGSRNTLTFAGECHALSVRGDGNVIVIGLSPGAMLDIQGNANRIRYTLGSPPALRIIGSGTRIEREEVPPGAAAPISLTGDGQVLDLDCAGRDVVIHGNRSHFVLRGGCRSVTADGAGNRVQAELAAGARARVDGNDSVLAYAVPGGGEADVAVRGERSQVERTDAAMPAAAEAPPAQAAPPAPQPLPMIPSSPADAAAPVPPSAQAAEEPPAAGPPMIAAGTPRLPALLRLLGARVVAQGTSVTIPADEVFQPRADVLRRGGDDKLHLLAQLAGIIHPSATQIAVADPADTDLATRRARALAAWLTANGVPVKQADVSGGAPTGELRVLLAR